MSYLGRSVDAISNVEKLDNITFNGGTTYALTKSSAAFTPAGANNILISIDGVVQQGNFSVSGSNIVFTFSPTSSNTCDFIMHYGTGLISTPADSSVTKDKANFISTSSAAGLQIKGDGTTDGTLQLNCSQNSHGVKIKSPAHSAGQSYTLTLPTTAPASNKMLQTDGSGNLSFVDAPSGGAWNLLETEDTSSGSSVDLTSMSSSYNLHAITFDLVRTTTDNETIKMMVFDSSDNSLQIYYANQYFQVAEGSSTTGTGTSGTYSTNPHNINFAGGIGTGSNEGFSGILYFTGLTDANDATLFWGQTQQFKHDNNYAHYLNAGRIANTAVAKIRFYGNGGNFEHGTIKLYGLS